MKISIDFSVYSKTSTAIGRISGSINLALIPRVGESVSLLWPINSTDEVKFMNAFVPHLKITNVIHVPGDEPKVMVTFEEAILSSDEEAKAFMLYLEKGFGLFADFFV